MASSSGAAPATRSARANAPTECTRMFMTRSRMTTPVRRSAPDQVRVAHQMQKRQRELAAEERSAAPSSAMNLRIHARSFASEFVRSIVAWLKLTFVQV